MKKEEKVLGDSGRILVREFGTKPLICIMAEAATEEECDKYTEDICKIS
ncbi:MAG: hypothetical protein ACOYA9_11770 [Bilifractor sp.]